MTTPYNTSRRSRMFFHWIALGLCLAAGGFREGSGQQATVRNAFVVPDGYDRLDYPEDSFSCWIQNLPLKRPPVPLNYQGKPVPAGFYNVWGVVGLPLLFRSNLEQCADFAMRFWAEYHRATGKLEQLYLFDYAGNRRFFRSSGQTLEQFLKTAFAGANSHSLKQGCRTVAPQDVRPGDLFVQNERGGTGHVSVILDMCRSKEGKRLFLIGYSFMPAQEFHIEKADAAYGTAGWFTMDGYIRYLADNLNFGPPVLRRFDP